MPYISSEKVQVFPAGLRGMHYNKSKFTTEDNLTLFSKISSNKNNHNHCYINPYDENYLIIKLEGYYFNIPKNVITSHESYSSSAIYAAIRLVDKSDNIGYVLANVNPNDTTSENQGLTNAVDQIYILDQGSGSNFKFYGLAIVDEAQLNTLRSASFYEGSDAYKTELRSIQLARGGQLTAQTLVLDSTEVRDKTSDKNISEQLTSTQILTKQITRADSNIPVTLDAEINFGGSRAKISNDLSIVAPLSTAGNGEVILRSSGDKSTTIVGPTNATIALPANAATNNQVFIQETAGVSSWLTYSKLANAANTLVQRDGTDIKTTTLNTLYLNPDSTNKFIIKSADNKTSILSVYGTMDITDNADVVIAKDVDIHANTNIAANVDIDAELNVGADTAKGAVNISSAGGKATTIIGTNDGTVYLPNSTALTKDGKNYIWVQSRSTADAYTNSWVQVTDAANVANAIVKTDSAGKIKATIEGEINKATTVKQITSSTNSNYSMLFTTSNTNNNYVSIYYNSGITVNPSTKTITATNFAGTATNSTNIGVTASSANANYPILVTDQKDTSSTKYIAAKYASDSLTLNPSTGTLNVKILSASTSITAPTISGTTEITTPKITATSVIGALTGNASTATQFSSDASVELTGDVTGSASSKKGWSIATTIKNSGVTAGSYGLSANATPGFGATFNVPYFTVNSKGLITAASTKTVTIPSTIATYNTLGLVKPAYTSSKSATFQPAAKSTSIKPTISTLSTEANRYYAVEADKDGRLFVNVPWVNTTYSVDAGDAGAGGGLTLTNGTIAHSNAVAAKTDKAESTSTLGWGGTFKIYEELYDEYGHVTGIKNSTKTLPSSIATYNKKGLVMPAYTSSGAAKLTTAAATNTTTPTIQAKTTTSSRYYGVEADKNGMLFVNVPWSNTTYSFTDNNPTLAWGTKSKVATVGGVDIHVTMPANPNTNTAHAHAAGDGISLSGSGGTSGTTTISLKESGVTAGSYGSSSNQTPGYGSTFNIPYITVDTYGRITSISNKTVKIPASDNTNTSHSHSAGVGLTGSGSAGTGSGTYTYKVNLVNETKSDNAASYTAGAATKFYAVQLDKNSKLGVYVPWSNTTYSFTDNNPTLAWGTKSKVATVGGVDIHVTMPANPNTDSKVSQVVSTDTNTSPRPLLLGNTWSDESDPRTGFTDTTATVIAAKNVYVRPKDGSLHVSGTIYSGGTTVSLNGHKHAAGDITSGTLAAARLPNATTSAKGAVIVGTGLSVSSGTVSLATSGATAGSYGSSSNQTPGYGDTFKIPYITVDTYGRITSIADKTVKIPASDNTNTSHTHTAGSGLTITGSGGISGETSYAVNTSFTTSASSRNYKVQVDSTSGGLYVNVPWTDNDTTYGIANASSLGLVKSSTTGTTANRDYNVQVNSDGTMKVNVPWVNTDTNTTYSTATSSTLGLVKIGFTTSGKNYAVQLSDGQMYVNVPWTDTNTTYSAGTNLSKSGTTFNVVSSPTFSGTVKAAYFDSSSDARLKTNFRPLELKKSILDLPIYKFDYIDGRAKDVIGCKAQDLQEICPELVAEDKDGFLSIHETKIVYLLLDEVKKLREELNELKNR